MEHQWYTQELRNKIEAVLKDKGSNHSPIDQMTEYIGQRITSDNAQFHAMKAKESGGTTLQIIEAAFFGAFGIRPKSDGWVKLNAEGQQKPAPKHPGETCHICGAEGYACEHIPGVPF